MPDAKTVPPRETPEGPAYQAVEQVAVKVARPAFLNHSQHTPADRPGNGLAAKPGTGKRDPAAKWAQDRAAREPGEAGVTKISTRQIK